MILMHELDDLHGLNPGNSLSCLPTSDPATALVGSGTTAPVHTHIHVCIMYRRGRGPWVVQLGQVNNSRRSKKKMLHTYINTCSLTQRCDLHIVVQSVASEAGADHENKPYL